MTNVFGDSDVYEAHPPADAKVLLRGQVLKGMNPGDPPAGYRKKANNGKEQDVNDPMMAVAWSRVFQNELGKENRILCRVKLSTVPSIAARTDPLTMSTLYDLTNRFDRVKPKMPAQVRTCGNVTILVGIVYKNCGR